MTVKFDGVELMMEDNMDKLEQQALLNHLVNKESYAMGIISVNSDNKKLIEVHLNEKYILDKIEGETIIRDFSVKNNEHYKIKNGIKYFVLEAK